MTAIRSVGAALLVGTRLLAPIHAQGLPVSDDFNTCGELAAQWTAIDPLGDSPIRLEGWGSTDAHLVIDVGGGASHDATGTSLPPRLVQATADVDFGIEARFDTQPLLRYQLEGILIEQDPGNWLRFDFYSKGTGVRVFAAETVGGVTTTRYNSAISVASGLPLYMRVLRAGNTYTQQWSTDGAGWTTAASFSSPMVVALTGVMAGNAGSFAPAFHARCDYFFELASPIVPEDGPLPEIYTLGLTSSGSGAVTADPSQAFYSCADEVQLTAVPDSGWRFDHWENDLSGSENPVSLLMSGDRDVQAVFSLENGPPTISAIEIESGATTALVRWQTDEPATSYVDWGTSNGYGQTTGDGSYVTAHEVALQGLLPATVHHLRLRSSDSAGNEGSSADQVFVTSFDLPAQSDDFDTCDGLSSLWKSADPLGGAAFSTSGAGTGDARLEIQVPGGISHDPFNVNRAPRVYQEVPDEDFQVETRFDSLPSQRFQIQGFMVEQDEDDWLRFDVYSDGTSLRLFAASTVQGLSTTVHNRAISVASAPLYLRLTRTGARWQQAWSLDGSSWNAGADFTRNLAVERLGLFAANSGANAPAYTGLFDYFFDTANPIVPEDGFLDPGPFDLDLVVLGNGQVATAPGSGPFACGTMVSATATADPGWAFDHWEGASSGIGNPTTVRMDRAQSLLAVFAEDSGPPLIDAISVQPYPTGARIQWLTNEPATSVVEYGQTSGYGAEVSSSALALEHSLLVEGLVPETLYHFRITSVDANSNSASSSDDIFLTLPAGAFLSDDFNRCSGFDGRWSLVDPLGDATIQAVGGGTSDARALISVPAGLSHDASGSNLAPRLMQAASDEDFTLEVKFDSLPTAGFQVQGVIVEQDADDWLRFDFYSTGTKLRVHASSTVAGTTTTLIDKKIAASLPLYMRVVRSGSSFVQSFSSDGLLFTPAGNFNRTLTVTQVGVFGGNAGSNPPAFTALVDYFFENQNPIEPEDGASGGGPYDLVIDVTGSGSVQRLPDLPFYDCGVEVTLSADPQPGWVFSSWSGDLSGSENPGTLRIGGPTGITAIFVQAGPPVISNVQVQAGSTTATVTWDTDVPATSVVDYGFDTGYGSTEADASLVLQHSLLLSGLDPESLYHFRVGSASAQGHVSHSSDAQFSTLPAGNLASDDFNGCAGLDPAWTIIDPLGGSTFDLVGAGTTDAQLLISVPAGASHDPFDVNRAPRIMQVVNDVDFEVEVKFESLPVAAYQIQGLFLEQDAANWLRFDFYSNGINLYAYAARTVAADSTTLWNTSLGSGLAAPLYMRVGRVGDQFTQRYSTDGVNWTSVGTTTNVMIVTSAGAFAANAGSNAPAYTGVLDYVFDTADPIDPEDGPSTDGPFVLTTEVIGQGNVQRTPDLPQYDCGAQVTLAASGDSGWRFDHWENDLGGFVNPAVVEMTNDKLVRAVFVFDDQPPIISNIVATPGSNAATISWVTNEPATSLVEYGLDSSYGLAAGNGGYVTSHAIALSGLTPSTTYHFRVTSVDGVGLSSSSGDLTFTTHAPSGVTPDDFNRFNLDRGLWAFVDPKDDGTLQMTGTGTADAQLRLGVPAGSAHDPYGTNQSVRVMQAVLDTDFDVGLKFESDLDKRFQIQGLIVEQDPSNWIRFDVFHDGSAVRAYCATHQNSVPTTRGNVSIFSGPWIGQGPIYLRVTRTGSSWLYRYSFDGSTWTTAAGPFSFAMNVGGVGPFVGNAGSGANPAPAHVAVIDWFQDLGNLLSSEDVGIPGDAEAPYLYRATTKSISGSTANVTWFTDESTQGWVEYGLTTSYELGSSPVVGPSYTPSYMLSGLDPLTTYHYRTVAQDANLLTTVSGDRSFTTTSGGGGGTLPFFTIWYGTQQQNGTIRQRFGHLGQPQTWVNVLGNVIDPDGSITGLTYSLNGGASHALNLGPDTRRLLKPGDFCAELAYSELLPGDNQVVLTATDNEGNQTQAVVVVEYTSGVVWPPSYTVDWSTSADVQDHVQIVDGKWALENDLLHPVELGYDRLFVFGDITHKNYEVTLTLTVNSLDPGGYVFPSNGPAVGLGMRWTGHTGNTQPRWGFWPTGCFAWYRWGPTPPQFELRTNQYQDSEFHPQVLDLGVPWIFKARCESQTGGTTAYSFKFWKASETEPANWILQVAGTATDPQAGSILVLAHHADVDFDNITVVGLGN